MVSSRTMTGSCHEDTPPPGSAQNVCVASSTEVTWLDRRRLQKLALGARRIADPDLATATEAYVRAVLLPRLRLEGYRRWLLAAWGALVAVTFVVDAMTERMGPGYSRASLSTPV